MAWRIVEWSRELARGTVANEKFPGVRFDAACADVDDFRPGEIVRVEVEREGGTLRIKRVSPEDPRFQTTTVDRAAPVLHEDVRRTADAALAGRREDGEYRIASLDDTALVVKGDVEEIVVMRPVYVDLPVRFRAKIMRLASEIERAYVHAHRFELSPHAIVLTMASDEEHFHFVVGDEIRVRTPPPPPLR